MQINQPSLVRKFIICAAELRTAQKRAQLITADDYNGFCRRQSRSSSIKMVARWAMLLPEHGQLRSV
ncbi:hypothetical protein CVM73_36805 [Bradyrhizobium forestalis]|uniref:Uncharacterized protein n=1 Tax=Bradyrhizobium forestalis TaxID=1419263 RepID=A0A2M8QXR4_9BRAD|nr:hypothetical protein CVM73_36805 [Bradyrhizobium forestalis]